MQQIFISRCFFLVALHFDTLVKLKSVFDNLFCHGKESLLSNFESKVLSLIINIQLDLFNYVFRS